MVPNTVDVNAYPDRASIGSHNLLLSAMWAYPPNETAGLMLAEEIVPALATRFPDVHLTLVGRSPTSSLLQASDGNDRVTVTGLVEDVRPHLAAAGAMPLPIFSGGGTRLKVLEAFAARPAREHRGVSRASPQPTGSTTSR